MLGISFPASHVAGDHAGTKDACREDGPCRRENGTAQHLEATSYKFNEGDLDDWSMDALRLEV